MAESSTSHTSDGEVEADRFATVVRVVGSVGPPTCRWETVRVEPDTTTPDIRVTPTDAPPDDLPVGELVEMLNEAFEVELGRRRAALLGEAPVAEPDSGVRAARGLLVAGCLGVCVWAGILALLVALA